MDNVHEMFPQGRPAPTEPEPPTISPRLTVVIATFPSTERDLLIRSCRAVEAQLRDDDELIVVIDYSGGSQEQLASEFATAGLNRVVTIGNREDLGLSGARNSGINTAKGTIVAFVDDDAEVAAGWRDRLLSHYSDPLVAGVSGAAVPQETVALPDWLPVTFSWVVGHGFDDGTPTTTREVPFFTGCNISFRRSVFASVGTFRTLIDGSKSNDPAAFAEADLCAAIHRELPDAKLIFDPSIQVLHRVPLELTTIRNFRKRCFGEGTTARSLQQAAGSDFGVAAAVRQVLQRNDPSDDANSVIKSAVAIAGKAAVVAGFLYADVRARIRGRKREPRLAPPIVWLPNNVHRIRPRVTRKPWSIGRD